MDVYNGGSRGSVEESKVTAAWPEYEADYLKKRLEAGNGKWDVGNNMTDAQQAVYLQEVAKHHEAESEECLKRDFKLWLQGLHPTYNDPNRVYDGQAERRHVYRKDGAEDVTTPMSGWRATPWGSDQLTHLEGVRQFLRDELEHGEEQTLYMNLLAEHGPQTLEEAWMYFKHWVAQRPLSEAQCEEFDSSPTDRLLRRLGNKALFGSMPHHMKNQGARAPPRARFAGSGTSGTASAPPKATATPPQPPSPPPDVKPDLSTLLGERTAGARPLPPKVADLSELQGTNKAAAQERADAASKEARAQIISAARGLAEQTQADPSYVPFEQTQRGREDIAAARYNVSRTERYLEGYAPKPDETDEQYQQERMRRMV